MTREDRHFGCLDAISNFESVSKEKQNKLKVNQAYKCAVIFLKSIMNSF